MNEFVAKKLGEVWAFSRIGLECQQRGGEAFAQKFSGLETDFHAALSNFAAAIEARADDVTRTKADKTTAKLRGMMEAYIGDEWDNPTELLEWMSFFLGSAAAHWSLVRGAAETTADSELGDIAQSAIRFYTGCLEYVINSLHAIGQERAG